MKTVMMLAVAVMMVALAVGNSYACDGCGGKGNAMHVHGTIAKVDGAKVTLKANDKDGKPSDKEIVFETSEKTAVTVNGKEAKVADLKGGMACCIYPTSGSATKIAAKAACPAK